MRRLTLVPTEEVRRDGLTTTTGATTGAAPVGRAHMTCTVCGVTHARYTNLCATCDPKGLLTPPPCVWPIRCYCPDHQGRAPLPLILTDTHRYAYVLPPRLTGKV